MFLHYASAELKILNNTMNLANIVSEYIFIF